MNNIAEDHTPTHNVNETVDRAGGRKKANKQFFHFSSLTKPTSENKINLEDKVTLTQIVLKERYAMRTSSKGSRLLFCLLLLFVMSLGCTPKPADLLKAYEKALNSHDVNGIIRFYAEDIRFEVVGGFVKVGRREVRELTKWDAAVNGQMTFTDIVVSGDTITCRAIERNDWLRLAGIEEVHYGSNTIVYNGVLISSIKAELTRKSSQAIGQALQSITEWASQERSQELAELMPEGEFVYSAELAEGWLALLSEWREEMRSRQEVRNAK